jgi:hypothetical protein
MLLKYVCILYLVVQQIELSLSPSLSRIYMQPTRAKKE